MDAYVGMKVRVTHTDYDEIPVGTVTHVVAADGEDAHLWCAEYPYGLFFFGHEFELAPKFAVGDRVRNALPGNDYDSDGTISAIKDDTYVIAWDSPELSTHGDLNWRDRDLETATLTIQAGRYYKTRDGRKVGPMRTAYGYDKQYPFTVDHGFEPNYGKAWRADGSYGLKSEPHKADLIAEWPATEDSYTTNAAAEVDNLRDEYGPFGADSNDNGKPKFKVGDYITRPNAKELGWSVDGYKVTKIAGGKVSLDSGTGTGYEARYDLTDDWIVVTSAPEPDTTLLVTMTADTSALDAEIDRVKRRLKKLAKRARKLGIRLDYDLAA